MFKKVNSKFDLPQTEDEILKFWDEDNTFEKSLDLRKDGPVYSFYDGPPFATGTPHYGHIVASTMKDVVPRYWTMQGYYVDRIWGWDCHGLPIENIAEKSLGITHKKEIREMGVEKFNETCRSKVLDYVKEWEVVIRRLGRWADMKHSYKTMDLTYMESVWWVFKELWDRDLIYEGYRSMHVCPRCETTLSQSEVSEGYKDVKDLSVIAKFHLLPNQKWGNGYVTKDKAYILAWTTTPWTLIGNVALAVGGDVLYTAIRFNEELLICASDRIKEIFKDDKEIEIVHENIQGRDLVGLKYEPLFDYYANDSKTKNRENGWQVVPADFVSTEEGTGVVHIAPAFGEDDMNLGKEHNLPFVQHVGMDGVISNQAGEFAGMHVKPIDDIQKTDVAIIKNLASKGLLFQKEQYLHSYPHCWRCETPLINYATSSWFVNIGKVKEDMLALSKEINWFPSYIKNGRFGKWLEGARDWSISRQRFWASVIPIWRCENCGELRVIGSVAELEELSGQKITDLHKHKVDPVTFPCQKCSGTMKRIPDVLDTWFDSGSMPYAQLHYPFQNKEKFEKSFPAHFIAEGIDQTRAWFYYLHVIGTAIKKKPAFKNVIVNGIVLAEDGKKMSKRLQNYPDPMKMFDKYGSDVMRFYILSSTVMQAENLNFTEADMADLSRGMFRMLWNSYSFFVLYANIDDWKPSKKGIASENILDKWILSELNTLMAEVNLNMKRYDLVKASRLFPPFVDNLSNWYIRRSRKRFWKSESDIDKNAAYQTLYTVLVELSKLLAPFTPFIAEEIYKNLTGNESVHLEDYPAANNDLIAKGLSEEMTETRSIIESGLAERSRLGIKVRQPLARLSYGKKKLSSEFEQIIADEVNVKAVVYSKGDEVTLDSVITPELKSEGEARELVRNIQSLRKTAGFEVENRIVLYYFSEKDEVSRFMQTFSDAIAKEVLAEEVLNKKVENIEASEEYKIGDNVVWVGIKRF